MEAWKEKKNLLNKSQYFHFFFFSIRKSSIYQRVLDYNFGVAKVKAVFVLSQAF